MSHFAHHKLGRYLILNEIAQGGMAQIYRAQLIGVAGFAKDVAIKKILPFWSQNSEFIDMLIDEANILVQLQHPNIVQVFELGKEHDSYFIVMEYVQGLDLRSLTKHLKKHNVTLPHEITAYIIKQICLGLDFAHHKSNLQGQSLNIVHRDISPQNILIGTEGEIKITDFGIAKTTQKTSQTQAGVLKGKFSYMSPEQALGEDIDQQTDIFATGLLLYELLFDQKCFDGKNDFEILEKVKNVRIQIDETTNSEIKHILNKALALNKNERYLSALDLFHDIENWEKQFSKRFLARDLKMFLQKHTPFIWPSTSAVVNQAISEEKTKPAIQLDSDSQYTIITQATTLWEPTVVHEPQAQNDVTLLNAPERTTLIDSSQNQERTKILSEPQMSHSDFRNTETQTGITSLINIFDVLSSYKNTVLGILLGLGLIIIFTTVYILPRPEPQQNTPLQDSSALTTSLEVPTEDAPTLIEKPQVPSEQTQPIVTPPETAQPLNANSTVESQANFKGIIKITAQPEAQITIKNNQDTFNAVGSWQWEKELIEPQTYSVQINLKKHKSQSFELTLSKDNPYFEKTVSLSPLVYGKLNIDSRPWSQFTIAGKTYSTPQNLSLPEGNYTLKVFAPSSKSTLSKSITIVPQGTTSCRAIFSSQNSLSCSQR